MISAGYDAHRGDPLAGLEVSTEGYARLARMIKDWVDRGYNLDAMGDSVVACLRTLQE